MVRPGIISVGIGIAVLILGIIAYPRRFQISAMAWHWKNGNSVRVANYDIPVRSNWLVKTQPLGGSLFVDTRFRGSPGVLSGINVISVDSLSLPTNDLDFWNSNKEKWLKENGISNPEQRSLNFEDEAVACLGGRELHDLMQVPDAADIISVDCRSSGRLHLMFIGRQDDLQVFYSIISGIHKQK
jgi:hypothetical protein